MGRKILVATAVFFLFLPSLLAQDKEAMITFGPALSFGKYKDLSQVDGLIAGGLPGVELAVRCAKHLEAWGSYTFSKTTYRMGHGSDRNFRLDAFAVGLRFKPVRLRDAEPFVGAGLNYYHFADDDYSPFVFPVSSAIGPYVQGGVCYRFLSRVHIQCAFTYNLMKHTEKRTTDLGTYHYRTDFSGLEFSVGLMFGIGGKQQQGAL